MNFSDLVVELSPVLMDFSVLLVTLMLTWLATKANRWIVANTSATRLDIINIAARDIVMFVEQVAEVRGFASNSDKKEFAVNSLIRDLGKLGIAISMEDADLQIEAAVNAFTSSALENFLDAEIGVIGI